MALDGVGTIFSNLDEADGGERPRDEIASIVIHDLVARRRPRGHVITFANEKGGVGKSTIAFHCAVALAHLDMRVLVIDCDRRQRSLDRLLQARDATARTLKVKLPRPKHAVLDNQSGALLLQEIERLGGGCDFVLIDLAGHDSPTARRAIAMADTLVTPVNCSPTDLDALGWINPVSRRFRQAGPFAEVVAALRRERHDRGLASFDWVVAKNRVRHCEHRMLATVDHNLATMARHLGFRTIAGLTESVSYRELLTFGVTQFDLRLLPEVGTPRSSHLRELRELVDGLRLPCPNRPARPARTAKSEAPVLTRVAENYRQALRGTAPPSEPATA
jgi:chromosome partitioning protein